MLKICAILQRFRSDTNGNIAAIFAIALVPLVGIVGMAVDFNRASAERAKLQSAADAAALMLSKEASKTAAADLQGKADKYFLAQLGKSEMTGLSVKPAYTRTGGSQLTLTVEGKVPAHFLSLLGSDRVTVGTVATVRWGTNRLRLALALDTTGSMQSSNKMTALKTATKNLLDQLQSASAEDGDIHVSIIPFSKNVNLGPANHGASWIDWTDWEAEPSIMATWKASNVSLWEQVNAGDPCPFNDTEHGFRCAASGTSTTVVTSVPSSGLICPATDSGRRFPSKIGIKYNGCYDSVEHTRTIATGSSASCGTLVNCTCSGSGNNRTCTQRYYSHTWVKNARSTWNGCVTDRGSAAGPSSDYDRKVDLPGASAASKFPAEQNHYCSAQVMGLSYQWSAMKTFVDSLYPDGATNQPIGLVWAWQSLVGGGPLTMPAKDSNYTYDEAIILMSDGLNTLNRWSGNGSATSTAVDGRMLESATVGTCNNVKKAGVTIYAVQVNTDTDPLSTLLRSCASSPDKFWMITQASELTEVFKMIGTNLTKLRIAK